MNTTHLRLKDATESILVEDEDTTTLEFIVANSIVAAAAIDTVWFVAVEETNCTSDDNSTDDYGHVVRAGFKFNNGHFLELVNYTVKDRIYKQSKKITYFYIESMLYPFVNFSETKTCFVLGNKGMAEIISYIEENGFNHLYSDFSNWPTYFSSLTSHVFHC